ncbi:ACT domain-containing protein [Ectothiorhodospiraceae bacterium BW-2]|nr:ACT domain-containing protein [Ectothiorhodospiraceae bacterium BW-2]
MRWYLLTLVGSDRPGIVATITTTLYQHGANLGEASMIRLGGNFTIMLMVEYAGDLQLLQQALSPICREQQLQFHLDPVQHQPHDHSQPDVHITLHGADRAGIVSRVTTALADAGLHILDMQSSVIGSDSDPIYLMQIEGIANEGIDALQQVMEQLRHAGITAHCRDSETLIG